MIILGIDPGITTTGYGVVEVTDESMKMLTYGAIRTNAEWKRESRLVYIFHELNRIISEFKPDVMSIEMLFFSRNINSALAVGEARGVALLAAGLAEMKVFEYTPLQVKECLTGYGRTCKNDVREIVQIELSLSKPPKPIDASDALALALTHHILQGLDSDSLLIG